MGHWGLDQEEGPLIIRIHNAHTPEPLILRNLGKVCKGDKRKK